VHQIVQAGWEGHRQNHKSDAAFTEQ
jgi:hypothetical protein